MPRRAEVEVSTLREALPRCGTAPAEVARRLGWMRSNRPTSPDTTRLRRALGMSVMVSHGRPRPLQETMSYERAVRITRAMGLDPVDVGL